MLFNEPKLLKHAGDAADPHPNRVSVLFNEPKLLKDAGRGAAMVVETCFSALQRAEIAEIAQFDQVAHGQPVSVLFNEPKLLKSTRSASYPVQSSSFSALQRAEIAEIELSEATNAFATPVSVLFNEPKLLKCGVDRPSVLALALEFQCSSTSRNC